MIDSARLARRQDHRLLRERRPPPHSGPGCLLQERRPPPHSGPGCLRLRQALSQVRSVGVHAVAGQAAVGAVGKGRAVGAVGEGCAVGAVGVGQSVAGAMECGGAGDVLGGGDGHHGQEQHNLGEHVAGVECGLPGCR
ncbi:hypothetical protein FOCC_FOCC002122, partial [Frankliniella occidentalis]